jgi:hypothetical protein
LILKKAATWAAFLFSGQFNAHRQTLRHSMRNNRLVRLTA